jgi:hypothetical protein
MDPAGLAVAAARWRISRLRRIDPHPFGLAPGIPQPAPRMLGTDAMDVTLAAAARAVLTRTPIPLCFMSVRYGDLFDLSSPLIEITTNWPTGHPDVNPLEYELSSVISDIFGASGRTCWPPSSPGTATWSPGPSSRPKARPCAGRSKAAFTALAGRSRRRPP